MRLNHVQRGHPFGMPVSQRQAGVDQHAVAVLHQPVPAPPCASRSIRSRSERIE